MKKIICIIMISLLLLVGCGSSGKGSKANNSSTPELGGQVDNSVIKDAMLKADKSFPEMNIASSDMDNAANLFAYISNVSYDKVESYVLAYAAAGTAEEIAVIKLKAKEDVEEMKKSIEAHVATRIKQFETYDPGQVPMCKDGVVFSNGNYVVLIMAKDVTSVKEAFYSCFK